MLMEASQLNSKGRFEEDKPTAANVLGITDMTPWDGATGCDFASVLQEDAGRVILVKWGEVTRKIGIDGSSAAIKEAIRNSFRLRSKRSFWLEDGDGVVRSFDRAMPLTTHTLHVDLASRFTMMMSAINTLSAVMMQLCTLKRISESFYPGLGGEH